MNERRLEIARRLVACNGWVWLPGMQISGSRALRIFGVYDDCAVVMGHSHCAMVMSTIDVLPDLDDDLTRLGVLAVARQAWNDETASVRFIDRHPLDPMWEYRGRWVCYGSTEEEALLSALESAS